MKNTKLLLGLGLFVAFGWLCGADVSAATYTVSNTFDSGAGSFRDAVAAANSNAGPDQIDFSIIGIGPQTINTLSTIVITDGELTINGLSQPGSACTSSAVTPLIVINYQFPTAEALTTSYGSVGAEPVEINGLAFRNGNLLAGSDNMTVRCNTFGTIDSQTAIGQSKLRLDHNDAIVEQNVFAVDTVDSSPVYFIDTIYGGGSPREGLQITGNSFGTDPTGTYDLTDSPSATVVGVVVGSDAEAMIGGLTPASDANVFKNLDMGVYIAGSDMAGMVAVMGNSFTDTGTAVVSPLDESVIRSVEESGGSTDINVELPDSYAQGEYRLEFYSNPTRRNSSFMPIQGEAPGLEFMHGVEASTLAGSATVTKNTDSSQTFSVTIAGTGYENVTILATLVDTGDYGHTSSLGYMHPGGTDLSIDVDTNVTAERCYPASSFSNWTVTVTNDGESTEREFAMMFTVETDESAFDFNAMSSAGTASSTSHLGVLDTDAPSGQVAVVVWEGVMAPGQTVVIDIPIAYGASDQIVTGIGVAANVPATMYDSDVLVSNLEDNLENYGLNTAVSCDVAADLAVEVELTDPGLTAGQTGQYVGTVTNNGPLSVPTPSAPTTLGASAGTISAIYLLGIPENVTAQTVYVNGQQICIADADELVSGYDVSGCNRTLCGVLDPATSSGPIADAIDASPYSVLLMCYDWHGLAEGEELDIEVNVLAGEDVAETAQFATTALLRSGGLVDVDTSLMTYDLSIQANIQGDGSITNNPIYWMAYPSNNTAVYIGLGPGSSTDPDPAGPSAPGSDVPVPASSLPYGVLAASGQPVKPRSALSLLIVLPAAAILYAFRRHRYSLSI
jgi:hypothetical protein